MAWLKQTLNFVLKFHPEGNLNYFQRNIFKNCGVFAQIWIENIIRHNVHENWQASSVHVRKCPSCLWSNGHSQWLHEHTSDWLIVAIFIASDQKKGTAKNGVQMLTIHIVLYLFHEFQNMWDGPVWSLNSCRIK